MTAPGEGPAKGWAAEAIYDRLLGRIASLATVGAGKLPTMGLAAGLSGHEIEPAPSVEWISDPSCHLAEQRVVGVIEGEQKGGEGSPECRSSSS
jgi:hypothetical protein